MKSGNIERLRLQAKEDGKHGYVQVRLYDLREILRKYDNARSVRRRTEECLSVLLEELLEWNEDVQQALGKKQKFKICQWPAFNKAQSFLASVNDPNTQGPRDD